MMGFARTWRRAVALTLPALVASLLVAEVLGRILVADPPPDFVVKADSFDSTYHHPYSFNPEKFPQPRTGLVRVLFLGDSFTEGGTKELANSGATVPNFTALALERCGLEASAMNAGVSSYSPIVEYLILKNIGLALRPNAVVLLLDEGDVQDDAIYTTEAVFDAAGAPVRVGAGTLSYAYPVYRSWLARRGLYAWEIVQDLRSGASGDRMPSSATALQRYNQRVFRHRSPWRAFADGADDESILQRFAHPIFNPAYRMSYNHSATGIDFGRFYEQTLRYVGLIADLCRRRDIPFLLVTYPYPFAIDPSPAAAELRHKWGYPIGGSLRSAFLPAVAEWASREGIAHVDLTEFFLQRTDRLPEYYFNGTNGGIVDEHFNEAGNAVIAEVLGVALCERVRPLQDRRTGTQVQGP
jgi:hypothetical protein